jgi:hypothetical protein
MGKLQYIYKRIIKISVESSSTAVDRRFQPCHGDWERFCHLFIVINADIMSKERAGIREK